MIFYTNHFPGRILHYNGKAHRYFGGTAYLGLQTDAAFQELFIKNVQKFGTNYAASRKSNVRFSVYKKAEALLARLSGSEASITLSSGYLAGQMISTYFASPGYKAFYAPSTHAALHRQSTKNHHTFKALQTAIKTQLKNHPEVTPVLYFDAIDPQESNYPRFEWLSSLPTAQLILVADDSHGLGITGHNGEGAYKTLQSFPAKALVICGSLGKGFGIQAGGIFGSQAIINTLKATDMFAASSPAAPGALATFLQAQHIYAKKRQILLEHITSFTKGIQDISQFSYIENYPVFSYADEALSARLLEHSMITTNFNYPNESAGTVSRIVLSAHHTGTDILQLIKAVNA